jgi:putative exporter of polyketide antibiotics
MVHMMSPFKLNFGNFVENFVISIKVPYESDFKKHSMNFVHCLLMLKIIVEMSLIPSFTHINWNELQLKFCNLLKWVLGHPFLFSLARAFTHPNCPL